MGEDYEYVLNAEQFAFMQKFDFLFRLNSLHHRITGEWSPILKMLMESATFKDLFGDMGIDDLLDRYSSTEGYEHNSVRHEQIRELWEILAPYLPEKKYKPQPERPELTEERWQELINSVFHKRDEDADK